MNFEKRIKEEVRELTKVFWTGAIRFTWGIPDPIVDVFDIGCEMNNGNKLLENTIDTLYNLCKEHSSTGFLIVAWRHNSIVVKHNP